MRRAENLARLSGPFDVLIIGGGATGLGVAVAARLATRPWSLMRAISAVGPALAVRTWCMAAFAICNKEG